MGNLILTLRESNSELLKTEGKDIVKWSKLKHVKNDFELFLLFNIAEILFKTIDGKDDSVICTNNTALIKILDIKKPEDKKKFVKFKGPVIKNKDPKFVMTWDLVNNTYKLIYLKSWQIANFISISPDNVLILDELINKILK